MRCSDVIGRLEELAPSSMACDWDNPGLLAGRMEKEVKKVWLALDATDDVIEEGVNWRADLILTHHPLIFRPLKKVNDQDFISRRILKLIQNDISYFAMHTNFDCAPGCMADLAADRLGLTNREVLEPMGELDGVSYGIGKTGMLKEEMTLDRLAQLVKEAFGLPFVTVYGDPEAFGLIRRVSVSPGSGGSMVEKALAAKAQVMITGDIGHHDGIDAVANQMAVIDAGHYGLEHIFMEFMETYLKETFGDQLEIRRSKTAFPAAVI